MDNNYIADDAVVKNSEIGTHVNIYKGAEIRGSQLEDHVTVGDQTIVQDSVIHSNTAINRRNYILRSDVGCFTYTGIGTMFRSAEIGRFCSISWNVSVGGGDHNDQYVTTSPLWRFHMLDTGEINRDSKVALNKTFDSQKSCIIGNDVWIASNVVILRDVKVGNGAVIGAGAIVTKDVEPYSVIVGVPAKTIRKRFDDKTIGVLEQVKWWDWPKDVIRENLALIYSTEINEAVLVRLMEVKAKLEKESE